MATCLLATGLVVFGTSGIAHADPVCATNGVYKLFARGSGAPFDSAEAQDFNNYVGFQLNQFGMGNGWAELGNLDNREYDPTTEYPAVPWTQYASGGLNLDGYYNSVNIGIAELVKHLNDRYDGDGPKGQGACSNEVVVLGGYSQGANVIGAALSRAWNGNRNWSISPETRRHIAFVALYGDPNTVCGGDWIRTDCRSQYQYAQGILGERNPYVPTGMDGRIGSWCDPYDGICTGTLLVSGFGSHGHAYHDTWISSSAREIALRAAEWRYQVFGVALPLNFSYSEMTTLSTIDVTPAPAAPPTIVAHVKRTNGPDGVHEVYASTMSAVTEGWWYPGGDGVHTDELIHISQDNIVGFDKVNEPDGATQSLYTAVPDGVWETWWRPNEGVHSNKIVTGLTGVRQVIAAPDVESGQYTHRLYLLAEDGPYEVWWREGGDGIHVSRLDNINGPVTMTKSVGPDGTDQLYVATPTYVYELWWRPGQGVNYDTVLHITQGDIRSLSKGANLPDGGQLLYTGTSTTAWQTYWNGTTGAGLSNGTIATGQTNAIQVEKDVYNGVHELYLATGDHVQEYWWNDTSSGGGELIRITQNNITSFDKSDDGAYQQIYTASGNLVYETYWAAGVSPTSSVLFSVTR